MSSYYNQLLSMNWVDFRITAIRSRDGRCDHCGVHFFDRQLNIHHPDYSWTGAETVNNVEVLCRPCHEKTHGITSWQFNNGNRLTVHRPPAAALPSSAYRYRRRSRRPPSHQLRLALEKVK
jgi:hypothetical protein